MAERVYLDNAATSFPKPPGVAAAVQHYQHDLGAAVGRGAYREGAEVQSVVRRCRKRVAELLRAESLERIVFTFNGTDSLNLALHGLLGPGDHAVTSVMEHNSVLRPLRWLADRRGVEVSTVGADATGRIDPADVQAALRPNTKLVALTHASNVTGTLQPAADFADVTRAARVLLLIDAAQSAGAVPINLHELPADLLACPGHKGLLGPLGTGLLSVRPGVEERLESLRQGGTGTQSEDDRQPERMPDKYESGNHNAPALFGLEAALAYLQERGVDAVRRHERELTAQLLDGFGSIPGVTVHGPRDAERQVGVVSISAADFEPQILAGILDESFRVQTRAGLHCAPGAHRHLGTLEYGGTVRFSVGPFTTTDDCDAAISAVREIVAG
jgi:cysteine desulfurase family protein